MIMTLFKAISEDVGEVADFTGALVIYRIQ
jgi:hypothetical protein